jgi:hypothetical protein
MPAVPAAARGRGEEAGAGGAVAGRQQRGRPDEHQRRSRRGQGGPEAGLLQPGIDRVPEPGPASPARMTSPVIPAFHDTGQYRVTHGQGGPIG